MLFQLWLLLLPLRAHTFHNFTRRHPSFQMTETATKQTERNNEKRKRSRHIASSEFKSSRVESS